MAGSDSTTFQGPAAGILAEPEGPTDESERTWLHRLGAPARRVGIGDVGVEDWFY
jgi:hypothetical protein